MYAYAHTPLEEGTINLTSFSSGDKFFAFVRGLSRPERTSKFFLQNKCQTSLIF